MELSQEARHHWIELFERCMDNGTNDEVVRLTQRLEVFSERLDEREQEGSCGDDEIPFNFGEGY